MAISLFAHHNKSRIGGLYRGTAGVGRQSNHHIGLMILLALMLAVVVSVAFARSAQSVNNHDSKIQDTPDTAAQLESTQSSESPAVSTGGSEEDAQPAEVTEMNTMSNRTTVTNGQAEVEIKINGEEVPVAPQGVTNQTVTDSTGQTQVNVNIQNGQTSSMTSTSDNGHVNSFSHSFQSTFFSGNNP